MKIRYYSDIHLEFSNFKIPEGDSETILVLAGDIGVGGSALQWIERNTKEYLAVIYVAGNHEFYVNKNIGKVQKSLKNADIPNLYFLENDKVTVGGIDFLGCTLWTDMNNDCPTAKAYCALRMNDYKIISARGTRYKRDQVWLTPDHTVAFHRESVAWLEKEIESAENPVVVVTHHSPVIEGLSRDRYKPSDLDYAYYTDLTHLMGKPKFWIFGHTHKQVDIDKNGTRVLSNPRGYERYFEFTNYHHRSIECDI
jgi:predicted phosphodiesterase